MSLDHARPLLVDPGDHDLRPVAPRAPARTAYTPVLILLTVLAALGVVLYAGFLFNPANRGDWLPYGMVIAAESILITQALLAMWTILSGAASPRDYAYFAAQESLFDPTGSAVRGAGRHEWPMLIGGREVDVDVFITVYGEPPETVRRTATAALAMAGLHRTWILDDGDSDEVRDLAAQLGCQYVRRLSSNGAKAGNVNHALSLAKGEYFAIFDADFVPSEEFLVETVPFFVADDVAFVQTPQTYGNLHTVISRGAGYLQTVFYRFIQPGRNHFNAAFCVGTNVVFRRAAIDGVGGMYTDSKSEDVWTSLMLHEAGWRSVYIPDVLAVGDAPETIEGFTKQQQRWATGGFEILLTRNPFAPRRNLTVDQRIMYGVTATHYLAGITPLLLLLVPPLEIYFDLRPVTMEMGIGTWALYYSGFYVMQILLAFFTVGSFRWEALLLATVSFPIYTRALIGVLLGREQKWHVTGSSHQAASPFAFIVPQVLMLTFLVPTSGVAVWRDVNHSTPTLATFWNITNTLILTSFVVTAVREHRRLRRPAPDVVVPVPAPEVSEQRTVVIRPAERTEPVAVAAHAATGAAPADHSAQGTGADAVPARRSDRHSSRRSRLRPTRSRSQARGRSSTVPEEVTS
ncbi:MAG: cellulose synthase catalytic subunit [Ornithinibacter sp.]